MSILQTSSYFDQTTPSIVLKSLFDKYDLDRNGKLDALEFSKLLKEDLGLDEEQTETYMLLLDQDADGKISFDEFQKWFHSGDKFETINDTTRYHFLRKAVEMFKKYDVNENGAIDAKEFHKLYKDLGGKKKKDEKKAMHEVDTDHNGKVSFQEFMKWLKWVPLKSLIL